MADTHTATPIPHTLDLFERWYIGHTRRAKGLVPRQNTVRAKVSRIRSVVALAGFETGEALALNLGNREAFVSLVDRLYAQEWATGTLIQTGTSLGLFAEFAKSRGWIAEAAQQPGDFPGRDEQRPVVVYTADELDVLVTSARGVGLRWWAFLATLADTGRRVGEVLDLRWDNFHPEHEPPYFDLPTTKNRRQAYMPLSKRLREQVYTAENVARLRVGEDVRRSCKRSPQDHPFPWTYAAAKDRYITFCERVGVPYRGVHCLRHSKATDMLTKGVPLHAVASLLGHSSVRTTERRYSHATTLNFASYLDAQAAVHA